MYTVKIVALDGPPIRTTTHRGQTYVGGTLGQRYEIRVQAPSHALSRSDRFLAVCTVDGLNVLDGKPGSIHGQGMVITTCSGAFDGWRTSLDEVAAFRISNPAASYAAGKGDESSVGVIGVAIFEEKHAVRSRSISPRPVPRPASVTKGARLSSAGTGFGEAHASSVSTTTFDRQPTPSEKFEIRYDTISALIEAGILEPPGPSAFPADDVAPTFCEAPK